MDATAEWGAAYERVRELVTGLGDEQAGTTVPACPGWTVRELLAHMIGLDADVVRGDEPDDHNSEWTQRQVDARADIPVEDLLAEWASVAGPLRAWMEANNSRPLGDIVIHEQDLRGALGVPGAQDTDGLHSLRDRMVGGFAGQVDGLAPVALVGDDWQWCSSGAPADADVVVRASDFDLTRAVMSRRSERQLRSWTERGDIEPYLEAFAGLGPLPEADLSE
jgi:uncharacterized protein (TIGR03083 family)